MEKKQKGKVTLIFFSSDMKELQEKRTYLLSLVLFSNENCFLTEELARLRYSGKTRKLNGKSLKYQVKNDQILGNKEVYLNKTFEIAELKD